MMMLQYLCKCKLQTQMKNKTFQNLKNWLKPLIIRSYRTKSIKTAVVDSSFTISYLKNTCGLSGKSLIRASNLVNFESSDERPNSVLKLFQSFGFSQTLVTKVISRAPVLLLCDAQKTLKPKLDFMLSVLKSDIELIKIIIGNSILLTRSLENQLIPTLNLLNSLMGNHKNAVEAIKCRPSILLWDIPNCVLPNVEFLQTLGVPRSQISRLVTAYGQAIARRPDRFSKVVLKVKEMGFDPSSVSFVNAVTAIIFVSDSTWESKFEVYRSFGFSSAEILSMFKKQPITMCVSKKKIRGAVEFFVNKLRWCPIKLSIRPFVMLYSLEKRIIPRCSVLQTLVSRNSIRKNFRITSIMGMTERNFLENYVIKYKDEVPEVLDAYEGAMSSSSNNVGWNNSDFRYIPRVCRCGKKTSIRIVDSNKPLKGKLYFVCDDCDFWAWCLPSTIISSETMTDTNEHNEGMGTQ